MRNSFRGGEGVFAGHRATTLRIASTTSAQQTKEKAKRLRNTKHLLAMRNMEGFTCLSPNWYSLTIATNW